MALEPPAIEARFWIGDSSVYQEHMHATCVMALPAPTGLLRGEDVVAMVSGPAPWASMAMDGVIEGRPDPDTWCLAYRATARRGNGQVHLAYCSSTYRRIDGHWWLVQHQQTPC